MLAILRHLSTVIPAKTGIQSSIANVAPGFPIAPLARSVGNDSELVTTNRALRLTALVIPAKAGIQSGVVNVAPGFPIAPLTRSVWNDVRRTKRISEEAA